MNVFPKTYGEVSYNSYARITGGKTFDGRDMPTWDDLGDRIQIAWEAAAKAAVHNWRHGPECECPESRPTGTGPEWYK